MTDRRQSKLQVTWSPNMRFGAQPFLYPVESLDQAVLVLNVLTDLEAWQAKPGYSVGGLEIYLNGDWVEFYDDQGRDINEILQASEEMV